MHISSSSAKILGKTNVQPREFTRSGSKAKDGENEERLKVGNNNGKLRIANATSGGVRKAAWAKIILLLYSIPYMSGPPGTSHTYSWVAFQEKLL